MGKIISFANQKGGVGKTTSCVNVAASLGMLGYKVLIIDLDPQGNTTSGVGIPKKGLKGGTRELLSGKMPVEEIIVDTPFQNLAVIPTNTALSSAEFDLFEFDETEKRMQIALEPVKDKYDYILIDCPPSLGMLTINAFTASDGVIVPMQCEFYALEGLSQLMITINRIKRLYNPELNVCGILITMYNGRLLLSMQVMAELQKHYSDKLFETKISRNVKLTEAPGFGRPVFYHDKNSKGAKEYMEVAKELSTRIEFWRTIMQKKPSGLGRGLGDLLEDNAPEITKSSSRVVIRAEDKRISVSTAELYTERPKNKSVKANYK